MIRNCVCLVLVTVFLECSVYRPMPLTSERVASELAPPKMAKVRVLAKILKHPLLPPLPFDARDGLSPDEAAILAVIANPGLRAVRDERGIARAQLLQAGILPNPVLSFSLERPTGGLTTDTVNAYGAQLDWEITSLITRSSRERAAADRVKAIDLSVAWREWQVAQEARLHCLRFFWVQKKISLLEQSREDLLKNLKRVQQAVASGEKTALDLAATKASLSRVQEDLTRTQWEQDQERLALNRAVGFPPERILPIQETTPSQDWLRRVGKDPQAHPEERRLDLLALRMGYQSREADLRTAVLSQFPKIGIGLIHAQDTGDVITTGPAVTLEFPLFDRNQGRIALERATRKKLFDEYTDRVFETRSQLAGILQQAESVRSRIRLAAGSVQTRRHLVETYGLALNRGNTDILSYVRAKNDLREKEIDLLNLQETLTDLGVAFEAASGQYIPLVREGGQEEKRPSKQIYLKGGSE